MIKYFLMFGFAFLLAHKGLAQYETLGEQLSDLTAAATIADPTERKSSLDKLLGRWSKIGKLPLHFYDSVAFVWRGEAQTVRWCGDFNGWCGGEQNLAAWEGKRIGDSDVFVLFAEFPLDARLDYKVVVDGKEWLLDELNPYRQMTGFGSDNSELRMLMWRADDINTVNPDIKKGTLSPNIIIASKALNYEVAVRIYTPAGYEKMKDLGSLYITDGHEYAHEKNGNIATILDNLIATKKIKPLIAVLIDPRRPDKLDLNRRMSELTMNENFADFVAKQLVPYVDSVYKTNKKPNKRCIVGTSLGGLNAAYLCAKYPQIFGLMAAQSPAFWYKPDIYQLFEQQTLPLKIAITTGIIHDTEDGARKMKVILEKKQYPLRYIEVNEGHSWGNWRNLIDDMLVFLMND